MRYHRKLEAEPWARRTRSGFLWSGTSRTWFPKTIAFETRLWEHATWEEHFVVAVSHTAWMAERWVDVDDERHTRKEAVKCPR